MANILIVARDDAPELSLLDSLPANAKVIAVGRTIEQFSNLTEQDWQSVNAILRANGGPFKSLLQQIWPSKVPNLKWIHTCSAGVDKILWPELTASDVIVTNGKGTFGHSLGEWAITACSWFAKDLPRMRANQKAHRWQGYQLEELRDKTLGIVGYGDIGQAAANIGRGFRMKVVALRRRLHLSEEEQTQGLQVIPPDRLNDLMATSDYIVAALPWTPETDKFISQSAIQSMKKTGVFINVGRGGNVDEPALIEALQSGSIRGAALDVTAVEPLPDDSPLWDLDNVLLSMHASCNTGTFRDESIGQWLKNVDRFINGKPLQNVVDKHQGY